MKVRESTVELEMEYLRYRIFRHSSIKTKAYFRGIRPMVDPNPGFVEQLKEYEKSIHQKERKVL